MVRNHETLQQSGYNEPRASQSAAVDDKLARSQPTQQRNNGEPNSPAQNTMVNAKGEKAPSQNAHIQNRFVHTPQANHINHRTALAQRLGEGTTEGALARLSGHRSEQEAGTPEMQMLPWHSSGSSRAG